MTSVVQVTRTVGARPHEVFEAWTDVDQLRQWFSPDPGVVAEASCDPVVGGGYRIVMLFDEGAYEVTGTYLVVEPPRRLVFTWSSDRTGGQDTHVTVTLEPDGEGTEMTITHERLPGREFQDNAPRVWTRIADHLDRFVATAG